MPKISEFFGIAICYFREHGPPHFHARYGGEEALEQEARSVKRIVEAEAREDYRLWVRFEDGTEGEVNLTDLVGTGGFESWQDPREFGKVRDDPETHTVAWPDGVELCPDALYDDLAGARFA